MTLCNHELPFLCWDHHHLWTVTGLITETSYLSHTCTYTPSISSYFRYFIYLALLTTCLSLEPSYLAQLCTYTGATHREEIFAHTGQDTFAL